uniref:Uncharacterized protein n=1 Tax=Arundo donax TaxID=35708 RepID=A0A0A9HCY0_ARUDO
MHVSRSGNPRSGSPRRQNRPIPMPVTAATAPATTARWFAAPPLPLLRERGHCCESKRAPGSWTRRRSRSRQRHPPRLPSSMRSGNRLSCGLLQSPATSSRGLCPAINRVP